jgi:hypothetical protein
MALTATHFPAHKQTFAIWFGPSERQQKDIIARLKRAETDATHPMLLPGILAELERGRQMHNVDEMVNGLEEQLTRIGQETVSSWRLSSQTKAERNRQKTDAWLNTTFSKNILLTSVALLHSMRRHLDEFQVATSWASAKQQHHLQRGYDSSHPGLAYAQPEVTHSLDRAVWSLSSNSNYQRYTVPDSAYNSRQNTLTDEPCSINDDEARYHDALQQASMRMKDRLTSLIAEYDDKIRHCTMEVDGMAMATQWVRSDSLPESKVSL